MSNQKINELIVTLEKAVKLADSLPNPMGDIEPSNKAINLIAQLGVIVHSKKPEIIKGFFDINR
ncbi:hypothetical protein NU104_002100 [Salmonella enterica]|nr:hypothetical protein [Salmonella enterica]EDR0943688.1 hypothetical protein [Salmonella enterica subsp. arizonae]EAR3201322.1 hypothetical protein [Salmonella enterica]EAY8011549.1 hypothetical protein [Salmonella enterica]ECO2486534.1 hypothetical protein [Salmonella enterica]